MGTNSTINYQALQVGNAGNPEAFDIISAASCNLEGRIVAGFSSIDTAGGAFAEMEEEIVASRAGREGESTPVAARYLTYTYGFEQFYPGRYTKLVPAGESKFMVWFLV
uniref:Uncharacterized protein n=1 Tax=viral metagenome TaxID=1070528 RepID=A0A6M3ILC0_9ZZZZ